MCGNVNTVLTRQYIIKSGMLQDFVKLTFAPLSTMIMVYCFGEQGQISFLANQRVYCYFAPRPIKMLEIRNHKQKERGKSIVFKGIRELEFLHFSSKTKRI